MAVFKQLPMSAFTVVLMRLGTHKTVVLNTTLSSSLIQAPAEVSVWRSSKGFYTQLRHLLPERPDLCWSPRLHVGMLRSASAYGLRCCQTCIRICANSCDTTALLQLAWYQQRSAPAGRVTVRIFVLLYRLCRRRVIAATTCTALFTD